MGGRGWRREQVPYSVIQDLASRKTVPLEGFVTAFLLDSKGRLWLGARQGRVGRLVFGL